MSLVVKWKSNTETEGFVINGNIYKVTAKTIRGNTVVTLKENEYQIKIENSSNNSYSSYGITQSEIVRWATDQILNNTGKCQECQSIKVVVQLSEGDKSYDEFRNFQVLCKKCRHEIYNQIGEKRRLEAEKEDQEFISFLDKDPPNIVGGFTDKYQAYEYLSQIEDDESLEDQDNDEDEFNETFTSVKAILKASDGTYYPVYCVIAVPGGELWDTSFIANNCEFLITQHIAMRYLGKKDE